MNMFQIATQNTILKPTPEHIGTVRLQQITPPDGIVLLLMTHPILCQIQFIHRIRQWDSSKSHNYAKIFAGERSKTNLLFSEMKQCKVLTQPLSK